MWSLSPRKCLRYLTCNPFGGRICGDVDPDEVSAIEPHDHEAIEHFKANGRDYDQGWRTFLHMMRVMLYEAAQSMMRSKKWSWLKAWAMQIARRRGMKKAIVALARRLAVIMHRIWVDGTEFRWTREQAVAAA